MADATQRKIIEPAQAVRHSFTLTDNETGDSWELPTLHGSIGPKVIDIRKLYGQSGVFIGLPLITDEYSDDECQVEDIWFSDLQDLPEAMSLAQVIRMIREQLRCSQMRLQ